MKQVVSYSLWGTLPKYTVGAVENARTIRALLPGWTPRFYCASSVPGGVLEDLRSAGAEIILMPEVGDIRGMFWRFLAFSDPKVDRALVRDTDSRVTLREAIAVQEWLASGKCGHIIRDHPYHSRAMMGGLWGASTQSLRDMDRWIREFDPKDRYDHDQAFLAARVYPILRREGVWIHDEYFNYEGSAQKISAPRINHEFVGEVIDDNGVRGPEWRAIAELEWNPLRRFAFQWKVRRMRREFETNWGS